jgi:hypothetical protein
LAGEPAASTLVPSAAGWVRARAKFAGVRVTFGSDRGDRKGKEYAADSASLDWLLVGDKPAVIHQFLRPAHAVVMCGGHNVHDKKTAKVMQGIMSTDAPRSGWLVCGYGPHRRMTGSATSLTEKIGDDSRAARCLTLFYEQAALVSAEQWLIRMHHTWRDSRLKSDQLRLAAVKRMLNDGLLHGGVRLAKITPERVFFSTPFGKTVPMSDLSDGYRTMLALALDLLRHVDYGFGLDRVLKTKNGRPYVSATGIVLIDEIDSHLHPTWQRLVGEWLHTCFPRMQFIVATHSPLIPTLVGKNEGMVVRLKAQTRRGVQVVVPEVDVGTSGLTADQMLTGPNFGLSSTRDLATENAMRQARSLRSRIRRGTATALEQRRFRKLEQDLNSRAPASADFVGITPWREQARDIKRLNEQLQTTNGHVP